jgi:hypothetical protein
VHARDALVGHRSFDEVYASGKRDVLSDAHAPALVGKGNNVWNRIRGEGTCRYLHATPTLENAASNAVCRKLGFELRKEFDFEFPPGNPMRGNDWRLDLEAGQ